jgi:alpha-beta hydrolase superfamily lysophospholipase
MPAGIAGTREFQYPTPDGSLLFVRDWPVSTQAGKPEGVVIMHGLGEHCGRYAHVAQFFQDCGLAVRTYDHRGHGQSGGARGDISDDEVLLRDGRMLINDFAQQLSGPPLLFGHSMGGLFAARLAAARLAPLRGLILSSPALAVPMTDFQEMLLKILKAVAPGFAVSNGVKTQYLSHDSKVVAAYENDKLVHGKISARLLSAMLNAMAYTLEHAPGLRIPVLLQVAREDKLIDPSGSERFYARLPPRFVSAHFYDGFYHEIFNETDAARVFNDLRYWLEQHHFTAARHQTG